MYTWFQSNVLKKQVLETKCEWECVKWEKTYTTLNSEIRLP